MSVGRLLGKKQNYFLWGLLNAKKSSSIMFLTILTHQKIQLMT